MQQTLQQFVQLTQQGGLALAVVLVAIVVTRAAIGILGRVEGYSIRHEVKDRMNQALIVRAVFFFSAVLIVFVGIIHPTGLGLMADLNLIGFYLPLSILIIAASRFVNDFFILSAFDNNVEVVGKKNVSVAIVEGGTYIGTAFVTVGALAGWEGGFITSCLWFGIGQIVFVLLAWLYRRAMPHVFTSLDGDNVACGISLKTPIQKIAD